MSTTTTNYGFEKPDVTDFYDVEVFNRNMDKADTKIREIETKVNNVSTMIDTTTHLKYKFGVNNGLPYIEEVE